MPSPVQGIIANVNTNAPLVSNTTGNAVTPITITTTTPHGIQNGDTVWIQNVGGNTAANGVFTATVTGSTTLTVPATGNGAYTSGGQVFDRYLKPAFNVPNDGDPLTASSVASAFQALADRTQSIWSVLQTCSLQLVFNITSSGSLPTAFPPGVQYALVVACGGGGGGGGGANGTTVASRIVPGSGGGGGAVQGIQLVQILNHALPYSVVIGGGGTGSSANTGSTGVAGGITQLKDPSATVVASFFAAGGGGAISNGATIQSVDATTGNTVFVFGGSPYVTNTAAGQYSVQVASQNNVSAPLSMWPLAPQMGGPGMVNNTVQSGLSGANNPGLGTAGATGGNGGGNSGTSWGGGGGGGGGGGAFGSGGSGGNAGIFGTTTGGNAVAGNVNTAPAANGGGGGGGGGAGGFGSSTPGNGGAGGNGAAGKMLIYYVIPS